MFGGSMFAEPMFGGAFGGVEAPGVPGFAFGVDLPASFGSDSTIAGARGSGRNLGGSRASGYRRAASGSGGRDLPAGGSSIEDVEGGS